MDNLDKKMKLMDCMNRMWKHFAEVVIARSEEKDNIEGFLEAKDQAHAIIAEMEE